jgi:hypothetical protein
MRWHEETQHCVDIAAAAGSGGLFSSSLGVAAAGWGCVGFSEPLLAPQPPAPLSKFINSLQSVNQGVVREQNACHSPRIHFASQTGHHVAAMCQSILGMH